MTAVLPAATPAPTPTPTSTAFAAPSWRTLVVVELRKAVDTRAGRALLATMLGIGLVIVLALAVWADAATAYTDLLAPVMVPLALLMPVIGVLVTTSEWSQRSAVTTFALVPRRGRVLLAKAAAVLLLVAAVVATLAVIAALVHLVRAGATGAAPDWSGAATSLGQLAVITVTTTATGVAYGSLLLSTPLAITAVFLVPTVYDLTATLTLGPVAQWITSSTWTSAVLGLSGGGAPLAPGTAVLSSLTIWLVVPIVVGTWRQLNREVR